MSAAIKIYENFIQIIFSITTAILISFIMTSHLKAADTDVSKEVKEAIDAIGAYSVEQKDAAVAEAKKMMDKLDARIDKIEMKLDSNWGEMKQASREKYAETLRSLRKQRNELSEWYGSMKHSSGNAWKEVKKGFSESYEVLVESWKKAEKEFAGEKEST